MKKQTEVQKAELDKESMKAAIREVMDEVTLNSAHGAGVLVDTIMKSLSEITDSFDQYYANNLAQNNPGVAAAYLELRVRAARASQKITQAKLTQLQSMHAKFQRSARVVATRKARKA
jgi:hypothetical protein